MKLTDNFTLEELTVSTTAVNNGIDNTPNDTQITNLKHLCYDILQPLRDALGKSIKITSGYRSPALNAKVGGSKTSDHMLGCAADIKVDGMTPSQIAQAIIELRLPFKQCIQEFNEWCHVSVPESGQSAKREVLTAVKKDGKTVYNLGLDKN